MSKKIKILLITLGSFFLIISCFIGIVAISGKAKIPYQEAKSYSHSWMNNITDDTLVQDIVIPGSHDSGTYNMNWTSETQTYTIKEQLATGVRYLDLRVKKKSKNQYVIYHGPTNGVNLLSVLKDIKDFIVANPSETIILDFQHFKRKSEKDVYHLLSSELYEDNLLVENTSTMSDLEFMSKLKLKDARGKCIAFFGEIEKDVVDNSPYIFLRNDNLSTFKNRCLTSHYVSSLNKKDSQTYIEKALPKYIEEIKTKISNEQYKGIFVLQGQLTDGLLIFGPYSKEKKHSTNMSNYIKQLKEHPDFSLINVIMRDFNTIEKNNEIIALNIYKNNIKEDLISNFKKEYNV